MEIPDAPAKPVKVAASQYHSLVLLEDGSVYSWGFGGKSLGLWGGIGGLGHGGSNDKTVPTLIEVFNTN